MNRKKKRIRPFAVFNVIFLGLVSFICIVPFINLVAISLSSSGAVALGKVNLLPVNFTLSSYQYALTGGKFTRALMISVVRTALGTLINVVVTSLAAYPMSRPDNQLPGRKFIVVYFVFTMMFGGGLIPSYINISRLGLKNTIWVWVIPGALGVSNMLLLMNFIRGLPGELEEAAIIDGASPMQVLARVFVPLLKPAIATITLFDMVGHWNEWFSSILYINRSENYPLQTYLHSISSNLEMMLRNDLQENAQDIMLSQINARTGRAAQMFLGALPMILVYPFLQKYFAKGLVIGSVKG